MRTDFQLSTSNFRNTWSEQALSGVCPLENHTIRKISIQPISQISRKQNSIGPICFRSLSKISSRTEV